MSSRCVAYARRFCPINRPSKSIWISCAPASLTTSIEPQALEIAADADLLDQALINLIRNAVDALRDTPAGIIRLSARRDQDGRVVLAVADNGPGVVPDQRDKIFVPFFTTKRHGSGIGLTIVRQIATAHGAGIDVSQTPGGGATFSLKF